MQKDASVYIDDLLFSINLIEKYVANLSYEDFEHSYDDQDKILRRLEIIAEAAKKLPSELRTHYNNISWKSIIGLRNIIAHTYDEVNFEEIWQIVKIHLPKTKKQIEEMKMELSKDK